MAMRSYPQALGVLAWVAALSLLGCSGPTPSPVTGNASTMSTQTMDDPPACTQDGVATAFETVVVYRCREVDSTNGKCVDAMCRGCVGKGMWSAQFECVPTS